MEESKIIEQYHQLRSTRAVAEIYGCSIETIRRVLIKHGVDRTGWKGSDEYKLPKKKYKYIRKYEPPRYDKVCPYCGREFVANRRNKVYCSKKCKDISIRVSKGIPCNTNIKPYHKVCCVCGDPFDSFREDRVTCSAECAYEWQKRSWRRHHTGMSWEEHVAKVKAEANERNAKKEMDKARKAFVRTIQAYANLQTPRECALCGHTFYDQYATTKYCSGECRRKASNRRKDKRIPKRQIIDTDITLQRLFRRDGGVCWICGERCDWDDMRTSENGHQYPGDKYPTKDHVIPVSRGGTESWDNVRLACWRCNCMEKRDSLYPYVPMDMEYAYKEKRLGQQQKKTAQYTLDGKLIKIWESTASIRRELGLNDKHIQNVCRRNKSNTGNAYGYHWEYVKEA